MLPRQLECVPLVELVVELRKKTTNLYGLMATMKMKMAMINQSLSGKAHLPFMLTINLVCVTIFKYNR